MKKFGLLALSAAMLVACNNATNPVVSDPIPSAAEPSISQPVESEPSETEPIESEPVESEPIESQPVESEPVESTEDVDDNIVQYISFANTTGSGEHDIESFSEFVVGAAVESVSNISKIYKSTGASGAHPNSDGIIKTGTAKAKGTFILTLSTPIDCLEINCHDFYALNEEHPTNSNIIWINEVDQLAPYNINGDAEKLVWNFEEPVSEIRFEANRVYLWDMTLKVNE